MEEAVRARAAAREALTDIEPDRLRDLLDARLAEASMTPGALVFVTARAVDPGADLDAAANRSAGVQLIYEGLRLTRRLAHEEPWAAVDDDTDEDVEADLEIVAADVLVSRGFYLLARTDAADRAVETVRSFGRDQTERQSAPNADAAALDRELEADVFALAVTAGTTAVAADGPPEALVSYAAGLARDAGAVGDLPAADRTLSEAATQRIVALSGNGDPDRVSATDG